MSIDVHAYQEKFDREIFDDPLFFHGTNTGNLNQVVEDDSYQTLDINISI
jgi:hypothetical protein